jgi:hypothetical protein
MWFSGPGLPIGPLSFCCYELTVRAASQPSHAEIVRPKSRFEICVRGGASPNFSKRRNVSTDSTPMYVGQPSWSKMTAHFGSFKITSGGLMGLRFIWFVLVQRDAIFMEWIRMRHKKTTITGTLPNINS